MSTKGVAKTLVDDTTAELLDHLHKVAKLEYGNKKDAEKLVKYVVKIVVKIGILIRNDQFNAQELKLLEKFQQKFHNVIMTAISFHEVDFTYDRDFFSSQVQGLEDILQKVVERHLREKSQKKITLIFGFFKNGDFLDKLFTSGGSYKGEMTIITKLLNKLVEEGNIWIIWNWFHRWTFLTKIKSNARVFLFVNVTYMLQILLSSGLTATCLFCSISCIFEPISYSYTMLVPIQYCHLKCWISLETHHMLEETRVLQIHPNTLIFIWSWLIWSWPGRHPHTQL